MMVAMTDAAMPPSRTTDPPAGSADAITDAPDRRPLYAQVRDLIVKRMVRGDWKPGAALPSEPQLARAFAVSQGTVRKALDELVAQNLLLRRQGRGTFVASHTPDRALFHFFHLVGADDRRRLPDSQVLDAVTGPATARETAGLALASPGPAVHRVCRLRRLDGRPAIHETVTVAADRFPDLVRDPASLPNSLYSLYESAYGITIARAVERLRAVAAAADDAAVLDLPVGTPLLEIERVAIGLDSRPAEWRLSRCDTRDHRYLTQLE